MFATCHASVNYMIDWPPPAKAEHSGNDTIVVGLLQQICLCFRTAHQVLHGRGLGLTLGCKHFPRHALAVMSQVAIELESGQSAARKSIFIM